MTPPPAAAAVARAAAMPAVHPRRAPLAPVRRPRRVSGPAAKPRTAQRARKAASPATAVATHPLLDRLIHGRAWIGIVAFALIGIVTMQLGLLKLNAGIGRALEHEAALQREDSALSVENSEVAAGDTVELQAAHMGMQLIPAGALRFLPAQGGAGDLTRAVTAAKASASTASSTSSETPASTGTGAEAGTETSATATSTAPGEPSSESTSAATPTSASTTATESTTPAATSTAAAEKPTEGAASTPSQPVQTPATTPAPTGESGGASASPQG